MNKNIDIKIEVISKLIKDDLLPFYYIKMFLGDFIKIDKVYTGYWKLKTYKKQWKDGLERIKENKNSCLILSIGGKSENPSSVYFLNLYKIEPFIFLQKEFLMNGELYEKLDNSKIITIENCYNLITPEKKDKSKFIIDS